MLHVLYCTVLYCTVLYCTVLYCTGLSLSNLLLSCRRWKFVEVRSFSPVFSQIGQFLWPSTVLKVLRMCVCNVCYLFCCRVCGRYLLSALVLPPLSPTAHRSHCFSAVLPMCTLTPCAFLAYSVSTRASVCVVLLYLEVVNTR